MKEVNGLSLPDREKHIDQVIQAGPYFAGLGTFQFKKFAAAFPRIKNFRHAIDIGAHVGMWTRVLARCFNIVTCFEPNPECEECFWANNPWQKCDDHSQIVLKQVALGATAGKTKINTQQQSQSTGWTRVDPENGDVEVEIATLDSFNLEWVDFVKIDVEGWEHNVVKGAHETLAKWKPLVIVEQKPNNAELHGLKQFGARDLLKKMGANEIATISGDVILTWK